MPDQSNAPSILTRDNDSMIAYRHTPGKFPGVMFLTGFKSDMEGGKALALETFCKERGHAFTRFDYSGHGESSGAFEDGAIGEWADDAVAVLDTVTKGPQILVGSSMGGWMMLLAALARPDRIAGLVGIAAAPDFTRDLIPHALSAQQKADLKSTGYCDIPNCYDDQEPYRIGQKLLDEGDNHILLDNDIPLDMPVRLIHGLLDEDVPWQTALKIMEKIKSTDVEVQFVKSGDHRLSEPHDIDRLLRTVGALLEVT